MNLRQIRYFIRTVEAGNITLAARQLHVAQPAVGLQIRQLEEEFGLPLIVRHSRGVAPTPAGRTFYDRCVSALRILEEAKREIVAYGSSRRESVSLGLTPGLITLLGSNLLFSAQTELPDLHVSLVEEMSHILVDSVLRQEIDVALTYEARPHSELLRTAMLEEELLLVTPDPKDGPGTAPVPLETVLQRPLVLTGERDPVRQQLMAVAARQGVGVKPAFEASSVATIKSVIARGAACGIMAYGSAATEIRQGRLGFRRIQGGPLRRTLYLVRSTHRAPLRQEALLFGFLARALRGASGELGELVHLLPTLDDIAPEQHHEAPSLSQAALTHCGTGAPQGKPVVPEALWAALRPLLPAEVVKARGGRPRHSDRAALAGILFVLHTGRPWYAMPAELGCSGRTAERRLGVWQASGNWERIRKVLQQHLPEVAPAHWRLIEPPRAAL